MHSLLVVVALLLSVLCCWLYRGLALRQQWFDIPNTRSAHKQPTPKGGGAGIFLALAASTFLAALVLGPWPATPGLLLVAAFALVATGLLDDIRGLPVGSRLLAYAIVSIAAVLFLMWPAPWAALCLAAIYLLWMANLYNFMDGIDGLAALETLFVCVAVAVLAGGSGGGEWQIVFCLLLAAVSAGFLVWNLPTASLFMGDAGSVCLGFLLGCLSLEAGFGLQLPVWLILLAVFVSDASATLLLRLVRGEAVTAAHNQHLYQRLARRWQSHQRVLWAVLAVNVLWLFPLAAAAVLWPHLCWWILAAAYAPLLAAVLISGKLP